MYDTLINYYLLTITYLYNCTLHDGVEIALSLARPILVYTWHSIRRGAAYFVADIEAYKLGVSRERLIAQRLAVFIESVLAIV
jgi:hypothetical protein